MPALGVAQEKGTLINWRKAEGQAVTRGEPLMEIETDKATVEIEAPASGVLANVTAFPGDEIPVGNKIAVLLAPGEEATERPHPLPLPEGEGMSEGRPVSREEERSGSRRLAEAEGITPSNRLLVGEGKGEGGRFTKKIPASPAAKRIAKERGIDLASIKGSGPSGSILVRDVMKSATPALTGPGASTTNKQLLQLTSMRRIVAERMTRSKQTAPHFYLSVDADMTVVTRHRESLKLTGERGVPSINDFVVHATAGALKKFPSLNAAFTEQGVELYSDINIGIAVALDDGLVVPVIRNADHLSLFELANHTGQLVQKTQARKLLPSDYAGATFTVSNLGMFGIDSFIAIISPPQCAILAVGRVGPRVVPHGEGIAVRPMMTLTLSVDHRVVDGAIAAQFFQALKKQLENGEREETQP